jgi:hypothetical protein
MDPDVDHKSGRNTDRAREGRVEETRRRER